MRSIKTCVLGVIAGSVAGVIGAVATVATNAPLRGLMFHAQGGLMAFGLLVTGYVLIFAPAAAGYALGGVDGDSDVDC